MDGQEDFYSETSSENWFSRILGSIKSVGFGILFFLLSFVVLFWNEGRTVKTYRALNEGLAQVVSVDATKVDAANEGKLVHLSGNITTTENLEDKEFGVNVNALRLKRTVEMYQWTEDKDTQKKKKVGGGEETTTTYNYKKEWSTKLHNSESFKKKKGHQNPSQFLYEGYENSVTNATIGGFTLSSGQINMMSSYEAHQISLDSGKVIPNSQLVNNKMFIGSGSPTTPTVGDVQVSFDVVNSGEYSIVAKQVGNSFVPFETSYLDISMLDKGKRTADEMFASAQEANTVFGWLFRIGGFFMMFMGLNMIFKPLTVIADVIPFLGNLLEMGLGFFSGIIAFSLSFVTIAVAWIFYRPILGIALLAIGLGAFFFFKKRADAKKEAQQA